VLKEYLDSQPANTPDKPIQVSMSVNDLTIGKLKNVLDGAGKYVSLTLTGSALKTIPDAAFCYISQISSYFNEGCPSLVGITIPDIRKTARFT
jgi:hypothetical protein